MELDIKLESCREKSGLYRSNEGDLHGVFYIPLYGGLELKVLSSGTTDGIWEHVSVSLPKRTPSWKEMCMVKDMFWNDEDVVMQLHPKKSDYVDLHKFCLHLWRPIKETIPTPHHLLVGPKTMKDVEALINE